MKEGILCVDKPAEHTSFDVIARLRGILKYKKLGHAGTLDPMVTGVLPVFIGRAAKAADLITDDSKCYHALIRLGVKTTTQDMTGEVVWSYNGSAPTAEQAKSTVFSFLGKSMQIPPMYSAVQKNGVRLYDLARQGIEVEREERTIEISAIENFTYNYPFISFDVHCSKGTYIRTLAHDIGEKLGCGGAIETLRRTVAISFTEEECYTLEEITEMVAQNRLDEVIREVDTVFADLPRVALSEKQARLFQNGFKLSCTRLSGVKEDKNHRVYDENGVFLGLAKPNFETDEFVLVKLFKIVNSQ